MLEQGGLKKGLKIALCWGLARYCPADGGRHPKRNPNPNHQQLHVKVELSRGLPTSREVKSAQVKLETWKWLKKQPLHSSRYSDPTRGKGRERCRNC